MHSEPFKWKKKMIRGCCTIVENKLPEVIRLPSTRWLFVLASCSTFLPRDTNFEAIILVDLLDETNPGYGAETGISPQTKHKH